MIASVLQFAGMVLIMVGAVLVVGFAGAVLCTGIVAMVIGIALERRDIDEDD